MKMKQQKEMILYIIVILILDHLAKPSVAYSWRCKDKRCVRSQTPDPESVLGSLDVCRLTCDSFGSVWPQPTGLTVISDKVVFINPSKISFNYSSVADFSRTDVGDLVTAMSRVFVSTLWQMCTANCSQVEDTTLTVVVTTSSSDLSLNWHTDESYSVNVITRGHQVIASIDADTVYGARHGLETLSQLITAVRSTLVMVATARISDKPVYAHRGLLLDTARNFLPLSAIKRSVDAMAACKMNVLHWHATDSQSLPLLLPRVPQLARYGAYSKDEVYTVSDIDMLIDYARARGVRILLELDMPAHAGNGWQWGPDVGLGSLAVCVNQQPWRQYCLQPPCGQLNPANPALYRVLRDVFQDLKAHLPDNEAIHMGGDEVYLPCWNQSHEVTDWMRSLGLGLSTEDFITVWGEFHKKVLQVWDQVMGHSKSSVVLWTSHLTNPDTISKFLDKDRFVIEAWTDATDPTADRLLEMGYRVIMATKDAWYLDHGFWGNTKYYNWRRVYDNRLPRSRGVLGGEVAMWGELVDAQNLDSRVWPRATAAAERLWSDPESSSGAAEDRLVTQRERLVWRGLRPAITTPQWCAHNPGLCTGSSNTS